MKPGTVGRWIVLVGALAVVDVRAGEAAAEAAGWPTAQQWAREVLREALTEPMAVLATGGFDSVAIAVRGETPDPAGLADAVGNFFYDHGYTVFVPDAGDSLGAGVWRFEMDVLAARIGEVRRGTGAFGLGRSQSLRQLEFGYRGRIVESATGRWVWRGVPQLRREHWAPTRRLESLDEDRPSWLGQPPQTASVEESRWWEKGMVAGLLAGVIVLYFDGTR